MQGSFMQGVVGNTAQSHVEGKCAVNKMPEMKKGHEALPDKIFKPYRDNGQSFLQVTKYNN